MSHVGGNNMSRLGPTGLTQLLTNIKTWVTTKLGNYVTTDTTQTITGRKLFTNPAIQLDSIVSMSGSTMFIDTSAAAPRGAWPAENHRVGRVYIGDNASYNGAWFIVDPIIDTNKAYYRMVTTNPDNTDSTRFSITWDSTKEGARRRRNVSQGDLLPSGNSTYNLGADDLKWDIGYIHNLIGSNKEDRTEDANNYYSTTSGSHMTFYTTTNGGTKLSNVPAAVNTQLESRTIRYLSSSDWIVEQICHNSFGLYYRKGTNGTWEDWKTFAFTNSNITGTAANVTGTVAIANGGTGATTRLSAVKALTNESVGTPTHFLAITTNWGKAGYTTVAQAKTVLGITGDIGSHSDSEYVHKTGDESISGAKTFSSNITINGTYLGTEASTNERTNIYLLANRDTAAASGAYISRFRQNRTQGAMGTSDSSFISFDFLENSTRYTRCFTMGLTDWDSDGVPQTYWLSSTSGKGSLGTAANAWNKVYANSYYLGTTSFTDKFVTTDTAQDIEGNKNFKGLLTTIPNGTIWPVTASTTDDITYLGANAIHVEQKGSGKLTDLSGGAWSVAELGVGCFFFRINNGADIRYKNFAQNTVNRIPVVSGANRFINDVTPNEDNTHSLGTQNLKWKDVYATNFYENGTALSSKYALNENFGKGTTTYLYIKAADFPTGSGVSSTIHYNNVVDGTKLYVWYSVCNSSNILGIYPTATQVTTATGQVWRYLGPTVYAVGLGNYGAAPEGILGLFRRES